MLGYTPSIKMSNTLYRNKNNQKPDMINENVNYQEYLRTNILDSHSRVDLQE